MNNMVMRGAVNNYQKYGVVSEVDDASPHRLIQMLFEGGLQRIAVAKGAMQRKDIAVKGASISRAIAIIGGLRSSLDHEQENELVNNLDSLYDYMTRRLLEANVHNDEEALDEVSSLLKEIKSAWDAIA